MSVDGVLVVARQELRLRVRAGRWRWLLAAFFAVLVLFTALLRAGLSNLPAQDLPFKGTVLYGGLMLFVLGLALLVVPALAAQSVNGDRERGTLAVLQVTRLSAGEIAVGKLVAAWGTSLVFLALTAPLVGYAMTQSGVPLGRVVVVTAVLALLLGTVCSVSLALSAVLSRTTTSGVLAYLVVFGLTVGTVVVFGLATAVTAERYVEDPRRSCPALSDLVDVPEPERQRIVEGCLAQPPYEASRSRTDRTWWLLAPNPFVVLADAAPQLPDATGMPSRYPDDVGPRASDLDPLGQLGRQVRDLRRPPPPLAPTAVLGPAEREEPGPVWPFGLAVDVLLGAGALWVTVRSLRTPTRSLPKGQRVA